MPEGPEILIQVNLLKPKCIGKKIIGIENNEKFQKSGVKIHANVLLPLTIIDIWSRGKVIVFETVDKNKNKLYITSQLGMSGNWVFEPGNHSNLWISFGCESNKSGYYVVTERIWYDDQMHFGQIGFYSDLSEVWRKHGPCLMLTALVDRNCLSTKELKPDQKIVTYDFYSKQIRNKRFKDKRVAEFMMDQSRVAGVGNYLRAEILYQAKISPDRSLTSLSDSEIKTIYDASLDVIYRSYISKGGYYVGKECGAGFKKLIYKQETDPNGYKVLTFRDKNDRMCYYVPEIQK